MVLRMQSQRYDESYPFTLSALRRIFLFSFHDCIGSRNNFQRAMVFLDILTYSSPIANQTVEIH